MAANTETTANTGSTAKPLAQADKVRPSRRGATGIDQPHR